MQWVLLLLGLALGGAFDESIEGALVGGLLGWCLGQALRLGSLARRSDQQALELEQARQALTAVQARLDALEGAVATPQPLPEATAPESALQWDLVAEPVPAEAPAFATADTVAAEPARPQEPDIFSTVFGAARDWLLGGNTVLRVGLVLLFLGLAFLLRYATENVAVPIELRYAGVATSALALLGLGWWLRFKRRGYGLLLQGAGVAVLYLTIFAAMRVHSLIDPGPAMGLLVAVTLCSAILAVLQDALGLACAAALGGFAAPILASTGAGSHVALFSYFALLNAGILAIAWFKAWRLLNLIGFVGTFGIGFAWGTRAYTPDLFWSTEPFLVLFFLMYLAIGLLFARRTLLDSPAPPADADRATLVRWAARQGDYVHGSILFGPPLVGFGLQWALVRHLEFGAAFSALSLGAIYMVLAWLLARRAPPRATLLTETCLALGVIFTSLAIPLGLDAQWTTAAWAVEGAGLYWLGLRQQRRLACWFALLLQAEAGYFCLQGFGHAFSYTPTGELGFSAALIGIAGLVCAWRQHAERQVSLLATGLLVWGGIWWVLACLAGVPLLVRWAWEMAALLVAFSASTALASFLAARLRWPGLAHLAMALAPLATLVLLGNWHAGFNPARDLGWLAWPVFFVVHFWALRRLAPWLGARVLTASHVLGAWLLVSLLAMQLSHGLGQLSGYYNAWRWLGWAVFPALYLLVVASPRQWPWPLGPHEQAYRWWAGWPLALVMVAWVWLANVFSDGSAEPLPYLPVANPLELGLLLVLYAVFVWARSVDGPIQRLRVRGPVGWILGGTLFAVLTAMVMRTAHHYAGVPYQLDTLLGSMLVQASLSIVWTLVALGLMIGGHLRARRYIWLVGAALIGLVVAKLFFVELSNHGGLARIVSFIGVGVLLLVVGYFAPLPPRRIEGAAGGNT
ncbi:DUF2339 domain-containing protein [Pseudomonas eucalypticola]|uniref:DUF2339 domain-containing protein n=1 Tax=Pseudomonas eucalypticola TaxID=2599595 RepID=A0A7D5D5G4_9PSED|nr:DUF2339 domain-containing protein [Pseudomonas eucalypticola]QKZ02641.1 DUF2339 domain-containing protein [Pseudomonas eucalypticola]